MENLPAKRGVLRANNPYQRFKQIFIYLFIYLFTAKFSSNETLAPYNKYNF